MTPPYAPRLVGDRVELLRTIGSGGCASVYLARHRETGALMAAKLVRAVRDHDELALRFRLEAELSAQLVHRNLVRVHDYFRERDGQPVLLMELLRGQTVEQYLNEHRTMPAAAAVAVICAVLRALHYAHEFGVVHRDIKPSNIFLACEPDGLVIPKLLDFGIAKRHRAGDPLLTQDGEVLGTPAYMSPEQVRGGEVSAASDLFTAAAVLYEMITGELAFGAPSAHGALAAVLEREVTQHPAIPSALWSVLERALCKDAARRPRGAAEFAQQLLDALALDAQGAEAAIAALGVVAPPLSTEPEGGNQPAFIELDATEHMQQASSAMAQTVMRGVSADPASSAEFVLTGGARASSAPPSWRRKRSAWLWGGAAAVVGIGLAAGLLGLRRNASPTPAEAAAWALPPSPPAWSLSDEPLPAPSVQDDPAHTFEPSAQEAPASEAPTAAQKSAAPHRAPTTTAGTSGRTPRPGRASPAAAAPGRASSASVPSSTTSKLRVATDPGF